MGEVVNRELKGQIAATWKMAYDGVCGAQKLLEEGKTVHQAIIHAVKAVEDNPDYVSVGFGGLPNIDGEVELDAAYMNGDTLGIGGVIEVKDLKNPIEVAYDLSKYQRNCLLSGEGAATYARRNGFAFCNMNTKKSMSRYWEEKKRDIDMEVLEAYKGHDTVCVIGKRRGEKTIACGVSTSGLFLKHPGRVGDSPVIGSGFYADSDVGSAAATGVGEDIMKGCLSFAIVERMRMGMGVQMACEEALTSHITNMEKKGHRAASISVIAMDSDNRVGAATNMEYFPFVVGDMAGGCQIYMASFRDGKTDIWKPDDRWLEAYEGD